MIVLRRAWILCSLITGCTLFDDPAEVATPRCAGDAQCDNGLACDGAERCAPEDPEADLFGCAPGDAGAVADDGIPCTEDRCVEQDGAPLLVHDTSACVCLTVEDCQSDASSTPCRPARCDLENNVCVPGDVLEAQACDTGTSCAPGKCDASGACVPTPDDGACDDSNACNGAERCEPTAQGADPVSGCVPGEPPARPDGEPSCALPSCEGDGPVVWSRDACACSKDGDCLSRACILGRCVDGACNYEGDTQIAVGVACDDGLACTIEEMCSAEGLCGITSQDALLHSFCEANHPCEEGSALCLPQGLPELEPPITADEDGCICLRN